FLQYDVYEEAIDVDLIVSLTAGMSGADLEKVHRETVLQTLSKNTGKIGQSTLLSSYLRPSATVLSLNKSLVWEIN
ncbi:hypothetical protein, partial [Alteromonas oceani]